MSLIEEPYQLVGRDEVVFSTGAALTGGVAFGGAIGLETDASAAVVELDGVLLAIY